MNKYEPSITKKDDESKDSIYIQNKYQSVQDIVFNSLRDEILNGNIPPGEKLTTADLAEKYGVSRTPIREALTRLKSLGLVETLPHRGAFVKQLSIDEIIEIFYIRGALAGMAVRFASQNLSDQNINELIRLCDSMEAILSSSPEAHEEILEINSRLHMIINTATGSTKLQDLLEQFHRMSASYRALGLELPGRDKEVCQEHRNIVMALKLGKAEEAEHHAREHYFNTARRIAESIGKSVNI